jgi:hypothetical protein
MNYILRINCPGQEFGLEDCEEKLTRRGWSHGGGFSYPPDGDEEDGWTTYCDCEEILKNRGDLKQVQAYYDRVNELFEKAEPEDDYPDEDDYI